MVALILLAWLILAGRLLHLQWLGHQQLGQRARQQRLYVETIQARPGEILDRQGRLLATSVSSRSLFVDPMQLQQPWHTALQLADALELDADKLYEQFAKHADKRFLWVKRRLSDLEAERVRQLDLPGDVWGFREEYLRRYPQGRLAAHVLGLRDIDGNGQGGVEESFDELLRGRDGQRVLERDALGHVLHVREEVARMPVQGEAIQLTLDAVIQLYAERELDALVEQWQPTSCCAVVIAPQTGEILAMASRPVFDPNDPTPADAAAWTNTAISSVFEPGSTIKPIILGGALQQNCVRPDEEIHCENGVYRMGRRQLHDHHPYGRLSVKDILVKSSNIGMAKIGERMTNAGIWKSVTSFGFGRLTGIELPGEVPGIVHPLRKWNSYSTGSVPMGHEIAVTPLQLTVAHAALANHGRRLAPEIVLRNVDANPSGAASISTRCLPAEICEWLVEDAMVDVVERGTGKAARLNETRVFGKTGTAQKIDPRSGQYVDDAHVCSFVCGAPAERPRVIVTVVVDAPRRSGPHFGGTVAAPAASRILKLTLPRLSHHDDQLPSPTGEPPLAGQPIPTR